MVAPTTSRSAPLVSSRNQGHQLPELVLAPSMPIMTSMTGLPFVLEREREDAAEGVASC